LKVTRIKVKKKVNYLVCVNAEKYSEVALHFACNLAKRNNGSVIILHVIESTDFQTTIGAIADKMREEIFQEAEDLLKHLADKVKKWSDIMPVIVVREGLIENEIISLVEEDRGINMLVVGTAPEKSLLKSKVLPAIVASLGSKLQIPMLIVPGNLTTKQIDELT
jgi:nucleotide-binding universal stress UspA family protein